MSPYWYLQTLSWKRYEISGDGRGLEIEYLPDPPMSRLARVEIFESQRFVCVTLYTRIHDHGGSKMPLVIRAVGLALLADVGNRKVYDGSTGRVGDLGIEPREEGWLPMPELWEQPDRFTRSDVPG